MAPPEPSSSESLTSSELTDGLAALLQHLERSGVTHLPRGEASQAAAWLAQTVRGDAAAGSATDVAAEPAAASPTASQQTAATPPAAPPSPPATTKQHTQQSPGAGSVAHPISYGSGLTRQEREHRLTQLAEQVAGCVRCEALACTRTQTVFGEGNPEARVCFFGEGPGSEEDRSGRPFVGRAGQLLTKMIEACKLAREDVYILNTVKCRPPNNRNPEPLEIDNCREYFESQLEWIQPEYIVCLGLVAAQSLLNSKLSVGKLRGRFHDYRNSKVLVTYHPAYLLRNPSAKRMAWQDLQIMLADMGVKV